MKYMGSKARHAKEILSIMMDWRRPDQWYVEPFCGGCNVIDKVDGLRLASDNHYYLIAMWRALQRGWTPPEMVTERAYRNVRDNKGDYPPGLVGFVGFGCSYSGKWFGGYARGNDDKGVPRNYSNESRRHVLGQVPKLKDVIFQCCNYQELSIPESSIVYCDPPYRNTTKYKSGDFDHDLFWNWVRNISKQGHKVFVSEYTAPDDFRCVWSKVVHNTLVKDTGAKQGIERLFVLGG